MKCSCGSVRLIARLLLFQFFFRLGGQKFWQFRVTGQKLVKVGPCQPNPGFNWKFTIQPDMQEVHRGTFKIIKNCSKKYWKTLSFLVFVAEKMFGNQRISTTFVENAWKTCGFSIVFVFHYGGQTNGKFESSGKNMSKLGKNGSSRVQLGSLVSRRMLLGFP